MECGCSARILASQILHTATCLSLPNPGTPDKKPCSTSAQRSLLPEPVLVLEIEFRRIPSPRNSRLNSQWSVLRTLPTEDGSASHSRTSRKQEAGPYPSSKPDGPYQELKSTQNCVNPLRLVLHCLVLRVLSSWSSQHARHSKTEPLP